MMNRHTITRETSKYNKYMLWRIQGFTTLSNGIEHEYYSQHTRTRKEAERIVERTKKIESGEIKL